MRRRYYYKYIIIGAILSVVNSLTPVLPETFLEVLVEDSAQMPCNILQKPGDSVEFVFWYKNQGANAFYTLDARRGRTLAEASHVRNETYAGRVLFHVTTSQPYLQMDSVKSEDTGDYFCRVDYQWSATEVTKVTLLVVVPPKKLIIRDDSGQEVRELAGPYKERSTISLSCEAQKGYPPANVTWWRDNKMWDSSFSAYSTGVLNDMKLVNLSRNELFVTFHCKAQNTLLKPPLIQTLVLDMYLYPVSVRLTSRLGILQAGRKIELRCESIGSRPSARITWWLGDSPLTDHTETVHDNVTSSVLWFLPKPRHHRSPLACRAQNPQLSDVPLEDVRLLNVTYKPEVSLRLIKEEDGRPPKEEDYVRLVCDVQANPVALKVGWYFENKVLNINQSGTDLLSGNTLVFKRLTRHNGGRYKCFADNEQGKGVSQELKLNVSHAPVCKANQQVTYAVGLNESASVRCEVEAEPGDVIFKWEFSNTVHKHYDLVHSSRGTVSTALYRPTTAADYGTLFCWANNSVGPQQSSCFFTVIAPACKTENVKINASSLSRDGSSEQWPPLALTTGAGIIAFVVVVASASVFYFKRIYLERKRRPIGIDRAIFEEDVCIYRAQYQNNGPQPHTLITK